MELAPGEYEKLSDDQLRATVDYFTERLYNVEQSLEGAIAQAALRGISLAEPEPSNVVSLAEYKLRKQLNERQK